MERVLIVGLGGFLGAVARYLLGGWLQRLSKSVSFPYGTLVINLTGCLIIGLLAYLAETRSGFSPELRSFLMIGVLGAFTTFSTFSNETINLLRDGQNLDSFLYVAAHLILSLLLVWSGRRLAYLIWR